jgi:asparagine synthase (glutamine-hydrolysing)
MCGIAGILGENASKDRIDRMLLAIARRGPDDRGDWVDPIAGIALGHTRLSIIDLSPLGHQPMTHGDGRYWITFNGEIYNYKELRRELEAEGSSFDSNTDTEIILAAFARWGERCIDRMRGMFAFALWDRRERRLCLVRDRLGIKPLLWAETRNGVVFASELKAMLASGLIEPVVEYQALFDILATGSVCQPRTIIKGIHSLTPGTILTVDASGIRSNRRYWDVAQASALLRPILAKLSYDDSVQLIRDKLEEACRYHLIADVPVGSFLSGGIDSTSVTALMSHYTSAKVKSFCVGFENNDEAQHELRFARIAADYIGSDHTEVIISGKDVSESFDDLIEVIDQPSYDGTNTYFVSRAAGASVKVTLSGLGGDEIFAGYPQFKTFQHAASRNANFFDRVLNQLHQLRPNHLTLPSAIRSLTNPRRYASIRRMLNDSTIAESLTPQMRHHFQPDFLEQYIRPMIDETIDTISQMSLVECQDYLLNVQLRDVDAMGMGHGLEVRPVLLDHVLVEHALALPPEAKVRRGRQKAVFVDAVRDIFPPDLITRPKKGFELPLGMWLRTELRDRVLASLDSSWCRAVFQPSFLADRAKHIDDPREAPLLWTMLIFVSWAEKSHLILSD